MLCYYKNGVSFFVQSIFYVKINIENALEFRFAYTNVYIHQTISLWKTHNFWRSNKSHFRIAKKYCTPNTIYLTQKI